MEGFCSTGQSPQRAVVPVGEEEEEEEEFNFKKGAFCLFPLYGDIYKFSVCFTVSTWSRHYKDQLVNAALGN